jgi:hypothetical protein
MKKGGAFEGRGCVPSSRAKFLRFKLSGIVKSFAATIVTFEIECCKARLSATSEADPFIKRRLQ